MITPEPTTATTPEPTTNATELALTKHRSRRLLATIRWCGGSPAPTFAGATEGCRFLEDARAVISFCEALRSNGSLEKVPCPYNESSETV